MESLLPCPSDATKESLTVDCPEFYKDSLIISDALDENCCFMRDNFYGFTREDDCPILLDYFVESDRRGYAELFNEPTLWSLFSFSSCVLMRSPYTI